MRIRSRLSGSLAALALTAACADPGSDTATAALSPGTSVTVTGGQIQGAVSEYDPDGMAFKGIPFAAPPVGDLRWRPPEPVVAWDGVRHATAPGPVCMQGGNQEQSEDCLFLNVWAPRESTEPLPVMVWVHGGGFVVGAGSDPLTDGTRLASRGIVVVALNYRLGALGFLAHPALSAESPHDASGNYGLLDTVAALEWVRDNAATFGGDPDQVTLFGESAGAGAVMSVMLMPQSRELFHRAIAESSFITGGTGACASRLAAHARPRRREARWARRWGRRETTRSPPCVPRPQPTCSPPSMALVWAGWAGSGPGPPTSMAGPSRTIRF